jgi:hypothetical protein
MRTTGVKGRVYLDLTREEAIHILEEKKLIGGYYRVVQRHLPKGNTEGNAPQVERRVAELDQEIADIARAIEASERPTLTDAEIERNIERSALFTFYLTYVCPSMQLEHLDPGRSI